MCIKSSTSFRSEISMKKIVVIYNCSCFSYSFSKKSLVQNAWHFLWKKSATSLPSWISPAGSGLVPGKIINARHPIYTGSPWGNVKVDEDWNCSPSSIFRSDTFMQCLCFPKISSEELFIPRTPIFWQSHKTAANNQYLSSCSAASAGVCPWAVDNE